MMQKAIYLIIATFVGWLFYLANIPAGWLLGAIFTGMIFGIFIKRYTFKRISFKFALAFVGANISLLLSFSMMKSIHHLFLPLVLTIFITISICMLFAVFLYKKSKYIDKITAFFCCIPGG